MTEMHSNKIILAKTDHSLLSRFIKDNLNYDKDGKLKMFLQKIEQAEVLEDEDFPWEVIRLNSKAIIRDTIARINYSYSVVLPGEADHRQCKVSVLSPIGRSLLGYRRGQDITWDTSGKKRNFTIMAVSQFTV